MIAAVALVTKRLLAAVELSRLPVAFGAVANTWLAVFVARADPALTLSEAASLPLGAALAAAAVLAVGFMTFGAALNDFLDAKHDRAFAPDRPIPSGSVRPHRAIQFAVAALFAGLLGALPFGPLALAVAMALACVVLAYDAFAKHVPALGIVLAGLATMLSMLAPSAEVTFTLPMWLAMSQTMGVGFIAYILGEKRPRLTTRAIALGALGWVFWSMVLFAVAAWRNDGEVLPAWFAAERIAIPVAVAVAGALVGSWKLRNARGPRATERLLRYGSLWKSLVTAAWLGALDMPLAAVAVGALAIVIFAAVAILREAGPQLSEPVGWRS
jgi:4-hydroxybenzoate polyprenyltransferase